MWERREKTGIGRKKKKEGAECAMRREREMREKERKEREEILNEDRRKIRWNRRDRMEKERRGGIERKLLFLLFLF
jgi:hypothetical protein